MLTGNISPEAGAMLERSPMLRFGRIVNTTVWDGVASASNRTERSDEVKFSILGIRRIGNFRKKEGAEFSIIVLVLSLSFSCVNVRLLFHGKATEKIGDG